MRISDWSSDVCSSDLFRAAQRPTIRAANEQEALACSCVAVVGAANNLVIELESASLQCGDPCAEVFALPGLDRLTCAGVARPPLHELGHVLYEKPLRSEERRVGKKWGRTCNTRWSPE